MWLVVAHSALAWPWSRRTEEFKPALPITPAEWQASQRKVPDLLASVKPQHRERCVNLLRGKAGRGWSQAWQDWMLYRNFFAGQERGVYLDIGTNEALTISNTAFFDLCLGWEGICFEPQEQYHTAIKRERSCKLVPECVMGRSTQIVMPTQGGHSAAFHDKAGKTGKGKGNGTKVGAVAPVKTRTCVGVLDEIAKAKFQTSNIDLISIDIEGAEPYVLSCFPWERLRARLVLIETNHLNQREVDAFFSRIGYANVATMLQTDSSFLDNLYMRLPGGPLAHPPMVGGCSPKDKELTGCCWVAGEAKTTGGEWRDFPITSTKASLARMVKQYQKYSYGDMGLDKWQCTDE